MALTFVGVKPVCAQYFSVRGNMLLLPTGTINAGISYDVSRKLSIDLAVVGNPVKLNSFSTMGFLVQPGVRYWLRETNYSHFFSLYANGGAYDLQFNDRTYKGFTAGVGVSWGYCFPIKKRLNIAIELGGSILYAQDVNQNLVSPDSQDHYIYTTDRILFAPTKLEVSLVYLF